MYSPTYSSPLWDIPEVHKALPRRSDSKFLPHKEEDKPESWSEPRRSTVGAEVLGVGAWLLLDLGLDFLELPKLFFGLVA